MSRALTLNEAVRDCDIAIMLGGVGAGKDRFLDWWRQSGAAHSRIPQELRVSSADVVLINLVPAPRSSLPIACVALSMIWDSLKALDRAADGSVLTRPSGRTKHWYTEVQFLSLFFDNVLPLVKTLQPRAVVIGNAQYLEKRALHWLLLLRTFGEQGHALLPRHALILSAQVEPGGEESSDFARLMNGHGETKLAWPRKLLLSPMSLNEFVTIVVTLVRRNLDAIFGSDVDPNELAKEFYAWTRGDWR